MVYMFANKNKTSILDWIPLAVLLYLLLPYVYACVYTQDTSPVDTIENTSNLLSQIDFSRPLTPAVEHTWYNYMAGKDPSYNTWAQFFT